VLDGFMAVSGAITITTQPVRIGGGAPAGQNVWHFQGFIDEPSLYNRALSSNEIAAIYATGSAGMCPPHAIVGLSATNGGVGSEVVITGANFSTVASNNIVYFGTVRASVISATATQLVVTVPPGASYAPISVTVNGLTTASRLPFSVTFASRGVIDTSLFAPPVVFGPVTVMGLGQLIERSVVGDMDGDGRNDVVLSCRTGPTGPFGLQVFLNQSSPGTFNSGSLGSGILIDSGSGRLGGLYVADVDGDGRLDLVARRDIAESNPQCDVYRNVSVPGSLAFAEKITVAPTNGLFFAVVGAGDLEGDGRPDLLGLSSNLTYFVLRNIGAPGNIAFEPPVEIISPCCALEDDPRLTDLDGDGKLEIVLAEKNARQVAIFQNIGPPGTLNTGSFAAPVRLPLIGGENRLQIADIDRDGRPDIVVTSGCTNFVTVFRNLSAPRSLTTNSFATGVKVSVGGAPLFLAIADFDGDGRPDIATGNCATNDPMCGASCHSNTLSVLRNLSEPGVVQAGSFAPPVSFAAGNAYPIPHAIDMDNNGVPDLVVGTFTGYFSVWRNTIAELCVLAPSGLVAWWKGEGNANDVVGTNHGTLLNGAGFGPGKAGQAFSFDGTDDYVYWPTAPALDLPGSFSLSLWGNANSLTGNSAQRYLFADFGNDGNVSQGSLGISNGRFGWLQSTTDAAVQRFSASSLLQTGVWYHVAVVRDDAAKQVRLYVNGVEEGQTNYSGRMVVPLQGRRVLGASGPEFDDYFAGRLDELAIFNRALTAEEIAAIYAAGASGFCPKAVILVNGHLYPSNNITVVDTAVEVVVQSSFSGGTMLYSLDGSPPNTGPFYTGPIILTESAIVRAIAFSSDFTQSVEADPVTITVLSPPVITAQPMGRTAILGENVQFDVVARGTPPLSYQWWRNGNPIPGATAASLLLGNVNLSDSGNYLAVVSNAFGVAISAEAMLTVLVPAGIVAHPAGTNVAPGGEAIFCVMAEGTEPVRFQWRKNGVRIPGATNACFTITNVQVADGGIYNVVAANVAGVATSGDARLVVNVPPRPPGNDLAERVGISNAIGSVSGTNFFATSEMSEPNHAGKVGGSSVWYKWRAPFAGVATFGTRGSTFDTLLAIYRGTDFNALTNVASDEDSGGFGTSELRYNTEEGVEYAIAIDGFAGAQGDFVLSWSLVMVTEPLPVITVQPQSRTVAQGSDVSFSVTAEGNSLSYQWILNGITITNATNTIYTVTNAQPDDVGAYVVRVSNTSTQRVESQPAFLEIGPPEGGASKDKFEDLFSAGNQPPGFTGGKRMLASTPGSASSGFLSVSMGTIASQTFNNIGATTQAGEPQPCTVGGSSKWFGLRPTADGTMEIDTLGSSFDTLLAVFTGTNSIETLRRVDCDDNGAPDLTSSLVRFPARRGTNYSILVDGVNGAEGIIQLNWRLGTLPTFTTPTQTVQSLRQGDSLLLEANAGSATADLSYRWYLNTQLVAGADSPQLVLTNLQPSQAGAYRVVAQNFAGSITGIVASVTVAEPIQVTATLVLTNGVRMLRLTGGAGRSNVIEASSNLSTWVPVHTNISEYGPLQFLEPASTNLSQRFYRVLPWR
jgi:hypothetical protein